ncbi:hypothetical protein LPJ77_002860 [Coemansia sp. RSA 2523]|nr:hypothetical protein LPJ77_002860 [Coemansia sp. RSA 2523]KAJ2156196.1 hypothetical protein GGH15_005607 [Coemansia sp. RSA 562]KAJ2197731.1 hypothetical protein IW145_005618 [Coemansia sp. RSA 521]KAJ2268504.1 hypothetical protein GGH14_005729 [Coemansia sp. RSA 370]KAJ2714574.1 hypothetical protein H4S00_005107 [Coemansia sp. D1744]
MRLRSKSAKIHCISEDDICIAPVWPSIPRNPVFYPPTALKNAHIDKVANSKAKADVEGKSNRLLARLRAIILPKNATATNNRRTLDSYDFKQQQYSAPSEDCKPAARPRLIARSAVREESILPDLFALADFGFATRTEKHRTYTAPLNVRRRPTESFVEAKHRRQHRAALTASVYVSQTSSRCSALPSADRFEDLGRFFGTGPQPFAPRTDSTIKRAATPMPMRAIDEHDDCAGSPRDSNSSDSTAILSPEASEHSPSERNDLSIRSGATQAPRISYSSSQHTLRAAGCNCAFDHPGYVCAENFLDMMTQQSLDALESCSSSRRPRSQGVSDHAHFPVADAGLGDGFMEHAALARSYRAMYIRTSCAESELVKTPFDLAKMLPDTPQ